MVARQRRRERVALRRTRDRHDLASLWARKDRTWEETTEGFVDEEETPCAGCGELCTFVTPCYRCGVEVCEVCEIQRCAEGFHACPFCGRSLANCYGYDET